MLVDLGLEQIDHGGSHCGPCYICLAKHRSLVPPSIRRLIEKPRAISWICWRRPTMNSRNVRNGSSADVSSPSALDGQ